jgi:pyridoxamine 5'-phosphate oxidase
MRIDYTKDELDERLVDPNPFTQFSLWFDQALASASGIEVNAMIVSTVSPDGQPSSRAVLLKGFDEAGLTFYTSYLSAKGVDIAGNPKGSALFYWPSMERQVRISGELERVNREESAAYFQTRPRGSQIAAHLGTQSQVVDGRESLVARYAELEQQFGDDVIDAPDYWGGYRLVPASFEFWQGRSNRLHDRVRYRLEPPNGWIIERLGP